MKSETPNFIYLKSRSKVQRLHGAHHTPERFKGRRPAPHSSCSSSSCTTAGDIPWKASPGSAYPRGPVGLHQELEEFYSWLAPSPGEHSRRKLALSRLREAVTKLWPKVKVEAFGSFRTGLYLPSSDLDLVMFGRWDSMPFRTLESELVDAGVAAPNSVSVLDNARVPIVKYTDKETRVRIDVSFNMISGLQAVEVVKMYKRKFPQLAKLVTVLKQFLVSRDLASVFTGGLSSFSLTIMAISFFQLHHRRAAHSSGTNLGVLLLEFLHLYGQSFNYSEVGISVREGGRYLRKEQLQCDAGVLWLENPLDPESNVAGGSFRIQEVARAFSRAFLSLSSSLRALEPRDSYLEAVFKDCELSTNVEA